MPVIGFTGPQTDTYDNSSSSSSLAPPMPLVAYQSITPLPHPPLWLSHSTVAFEQTAASATPEILDAVQTT